MNSTSTRADVLTAEMKKAFGRGRSECRIVRSPYRICPLGAHIDHQQGIVTGMCIDHSVLLAFAPNSDSTIRMTSKNFPGTVTFSIEDELVAENKNWGNYLKGAVYALKKMYPLRFGFDGIIEGNLPIGGLSSSAAVGLAYLLALEHVNGIETTRADNIRLDQIIENEFIGLNNGILDQSAILLSEKDRLLYLDCQTGDSETIPASKQIQNFEILVVYSGLSRALTGTGYNQRVHECRQAARFLLENNGTAFAENPVLRDVPASIFENYQHKLSENLHKRARHFFTELDRVLRGREVWQQGNLVEFGALVNQSGESSIENYECGSPHLITIYRILTNTPGVYGSRFSGAGFRGCCIGLVDPRYREQIAHTIHSEYPKIHPDIESTYSIYFCQSDHGASIL
ncbi:hypothetical protein JXJ21_12540 [candidate division KSB1 bacterium]|nr:hypothetical protein [candidate division KSB1 bacterium]